MTMRSALLSIAVLCAPFGSVGAEEPDDPVPLFSETGTLDIEISAPWRRLKREREEDGPYQALVGYADRDGRHHTVAATVERRGLTRQRICRMPPIQLRFEKDDVEGTLFEGNKSIKVVTHCRKGNRWTRYYQREMLAYRIYNRVTDLSFRVRAMTVNYRDDERDRVDGPRFAFMIEDDKLAGDRHGLDKLEQRSISPRQLPSLETSRFALFHYLIGNADWSALSGPGDECCHNAKLIGEDSLDPVDAVPYDFDASGLVDAHYAVPTQELGVRDITVRVFRGFCVHNDGLDAARREFIAMEDEIEAIVERQTLMSERDRRRVRQYFGQFFNILRGDKRFGREVIDGCRK